MSMDRYRNRMNILEKEQHVVQNLKCLSFELKDTVQRHYEREIEAVKGKIGWLEKLEQKQAQQPTPDGAA